jgi:HEAT repeat protein
MKRFRRTPRGCPPVALAPSTLACLAAAAALLAVPWGCLFARPVSSQDPGAASKPAASAFALKRVQKLGAEDLRQLLLNVPEVALDHVPNTTKGLTTVASRLRANNLVYPGPVLLRGQRPDLAGLFFRVGQGSHLGKEPAETLQVLSRQLRVHLEAAVKAGDGVRPDPDKLRGLLLGAKRGGWLKPEAIPALMQLLQAENEPVRALLVELLGKIKGREASQALAMRAVTDLSPKVREQAARQLRARPPEEYGSVLEEGLVYPWPAVAYHSAEALAALRLEKAVPSLVKMLDEPDLNLPFEVKERGRAVPVIREMVRVNHLANCVLCHAPSEDRGDPVRGAVPAAGQPLPAPATTPAYYERGGSFVRADVTYLRQDFSVVQPVAAPGKWPAHQRYDYLVRLRPLTRQQAALARERAKAEKVTAQKRAMLFALRELTGKDLGTTTKEWEEVLSPGERPKPPPAREEAAVLAGAREGFGGRPTETEGQRRQKLVALAASVAGREGADREKARAELVRRLAGLPGTELAGYLKSELDELRRAAAAACAANGDKSHIPALIGMLEERDPEVVQSARRALTTLTKQDFGPKPEDTAAARAKAVKDWALWWQKQLGR